MLVAPWHEVFDAALRVAVEDRTERGIDVVDRVNRGQLAGGDERGEHCPVLGTDFVPGEEGILSCEGDRPDLVFDRVGVELERAVFQEVDQAGPVCEGVSDVLGQLGFLRDAGQLSLEPGFERGDEVPLVS